MQKIQYDLLNGTSPIKNLAEKYGFSDVYTFSRQFRKYTGATPAAFRKNI